MCGVFALAVEISNDFLKFVLDPQTARFTVIVNKGDPSNPRDDGKPLLYDKGYPPTTHAIIGIDKRKYTVGDFGKLVEAKGGAASYRYKWKLPRGVMLTQNLRAGYGDSPQYAFVEYIIENNGKKPVEVSFKLFLDTFIAGNDNVPFVVPGAGILKIETALKGERVPSLWYAYDDVASPTVRAVGLCRLEGHKVPSAVYFTTYGVGVKGWEPPIRGRKLKGDSVVVYLWKGIHLSPGGEVKLGVAYGVYLATTASGDSFAAALSVPERVKGEFIVTLDVANRLNSSLENLEARLVLPAELVLPTGEALVKKVPVLSPFDTVSFAWKVLPGDLSKTVATSLSVELKAESAGKVQEVSLSRNLTIEKVEVKKVEVKKSETGLVINLPNIGFKEGSAELTQEARETLLKVVAQLEKLYAKYGDKMKVIIEGHTDSKGSEEYNLKLSRERAAAVLNFVLSHSELPEGIFQTVGYGESKPVAPNETEWGRAQNRRVEFRIAFTR